MMQLGEVETDFTKEINEAFKFFDKDGDGEVRACFACVHGAPAIVSSVVGYVRGTQCFLFWHCSPTLARRWPGLSVPLW